MEIKNKAFLLLGIAVVVLMSLPFAKNLFFAAVSNVTVFVPGVTQNQGGGGGSSYYPVVIAPTLTPLPKPVPVAIEQLPAPAPAKNPVQPTVNPTAPQKENAPQPSVSMLPSAIADLSQKIPELATILSNLNVKNAQDVSNLQNYNIFLPGLAAITETNEMPSDTMFVLLGNKNIDAQTQLDVSENAATPEKINVLVAEPMHLVIKPSSPATSMTGYMLFESPNLPNPGQSYSVLKFNYVDNNDGTFVADINSPSVAGQYQIVTNINFVDPKLAQKEIKTTTLVDPDGYIYEKIDNGELRINGSIVSLYQLNSKNQYELWQAGEYGQENPETTDNTGNYSFLVPAGTYYLTVTAQGYQSYQSDKYSVAEGKEIKFNVELKKQLDLYSLLNWNTILIIILFILVGFNFYRDMQIRKK
jgi:hypothetical protein